MVESQEKVTLIPAMLQRAELWQQEGKLHQAMHIYFRLVENFPESEEAHEAVERLSRLAQELEEQGKVYMAMGIRERLAAPPGPLTRLKILSPGGRPM